MRYCMLAILLLSSVAVPASDLQPFTTDGCSNFPEGTLAQNKLWLACCTTHDVAYWQGGTYDERVQADVELKECVSDVGEPEIALVMLAGVRVGGTPYLPTSFRWGYGWPYPRGYRRLSKAEHREVRAKLKMDQNHSPVSIPN